MHSLAYRVEVAGQVLTHTYIGLQGDRQSTQHYEWQKLVPNACQVFVGTQFRDALPRRCVVVRWKLKWCAVGRKVLAATYRREIKGSGLLGAIAGEIAGKG